MRISNRELSMQWCLVFAAMAGPASAGAQTSVAASVRERNECRLATQVLSTGVPEAKFTWAVRRIDTCPQAGVALGRALLRTRAGSADEEAVVASANLLDDRHVLRAAVDVLGNRAAPSAKQLAALRVLVPLINPRYRVDTTRYAMLEWGVLAGQLDGDPAPTAAPVTDPDRTAALSAIETVGARSTTELASRVASAIARTFRYLAEPR